MKKIKNIWMVVLAVLGVCTVAKFALPSIGTTSQAADVLNLGGLQPVTLITSGVYEATNGIDESQTCTFTNAVIDCRSGKDVMLSFKFALNTSGTTAGSLTLQGSVDGVNWGTAGTSTFSPAIAFTPAGTAAVILNTNISVLGMPWIRVRTIVNGANTGASITNYTVKYFTK